MIAVKYNMKEKLFPLKRVQDCLVQIQIEI